MFHYSMFEKVQSMKAEYLNIRRSVNMNVNVWYVDKKDWFIMKLMYKAVYFWMILYIILMSKFGFFPEWYYNILVRM